METVGEPESQLQPTPEIPPDTGRKHPIAVIFHLFWKAAALIVYICLYYFVNDYVVTVVVVLLLLAADFWTVKNVTGRLLARMRYSPLSHLPRDRRGIGRGPGAGKED